MLNVIPEVMTSTGVLMSLWKHECFRVVADRFTTQTDKDWFEKSVSQVTTLTTVRNFLNRHVEAEHFKHFRSNI